MVLDKLQFIGVVLLIQFLVVVNAFKNCVVNEHNLHPNVLESFQQRNLTIRDQPFIYFQKIIFQAAVENIVYEQQLKKNLTTGRPIKIDPSKKSNYFLLQLEQQQNYYIEQKIFAFEDKKIVGLVEIDKKMVIVFNQGNLRVVNLQNNTLEEDQMDTKVKDVQGVQDFKFRNVQYFAVYGRSLSIIRFKNGELSCLYNETESYEFPISNIVHSDGKVFYFTTKVLVTVNLLSQEIEKKITINDYLQCYLFYLFQNTLLILPDNQGNATSTFMLYELNYPSKPQQVHKLRNELSGIKSAVTQYQGQILVKNFENEIRSIEFEQSNIQVRNQTSEKLNIAIDYTITSSRQIYALDQKDDGYTSFQCNHCDLDKFLKVSEVSPPFCQQCGYKCQECIDDKKCTLCSQSYSQLNGICQCANRYIENLEKGICEKLEEADPLIKIIIISTIFVVLIFIGVVKYLQIRERKRIEAKEKLFKSTFKDEEDDETFNNEEEDEYDEEDLQQNNVTALYDRNNPNLSINQSTRDSHNTSTSKKAQKASQNKSFAQQKHQGKAVQLEDLDESMKNRIHTINENENEDEDEENHSHHSENEDQERQEEYQEEEEDDDEDEDYEDEEIEH